MNRVLLAVSFLVLGAHDLLAQSPPRLVPAAGMVRDAAGTLRNGPALVTFAIYTAREGGEPLWKETQSLTLDAAGWYSTLLGATQPEGLPLELFREGEARWLAVSIDGGPELPRTFWASVPYALKAADAETIGGLPLEAFVVNGAYRKSGDAARSRAPKADGDGVPAAAAASFADDPTAELVVPEDLIVQGSTCTGFDCVDGESFGVDTIRLKENNLRIHFEDTSTSAGFAANDWRIVVNDQPSGGANYFAIEDATAARTPFRIAAGAPTNALYVDAVGRIGSGTNNPALDIHKVTGNTPAIRLEQNSTGGFSPQTWDIAGNEANFFVRDLSAGSRLPFRIMPGAATSTLVLASNSNLGSGTTSPDGSFEIEKTGVDVTMLLSNTSGVRWEMKNNNATGRLTLGPVGGSVPFKLTSTAGENLLRLGVLAANTVDINGNLVVTGSCCAPDYVFEPEYALRPLAELEAYVKANKHLPGVPSAAEIAANGLNMREMNYALLEKIEELVLYTLQQQKAIDDLQNRLQLLEAEKR
jgi:hypothetical protein